MNPSNVSNSASHRLYTGSSGSRSILENFLVIRPPLTDFNVAAEGRLQKNVIDRTPSLPTYRDIKVKKLPFYDVLSEIIAPRSLIPSPTEGIVRERAFSFSLTPKQSKDVALSKANSVGPNEETIGNQLEIQLRICKLDGASEPTDNYPPSLCIHVNGSAVQLPAFNVSNRPGVAPKRPSLPLNIINYVKLTPSYSNTIKIRWVSEPLGPSWAMVLNLVRKLNSADLVARLQAKGPKPMEYTKGMIQAIVSRDDGECQIAMTSLKVSIACPLGQGRMTFPCRASTCSHLQCFDANLFLQMNEKKPTWNCPVCDKTLLFDDLFIDGYFLQVISSLPLDCNYEIEVLPDGSWSSSSAKRGKVYRPPAKRIRSGENLLHKTICLDDDSFVDDNQENCLPQSKRSSRSINTRSPIPRKSVDIVDLTVSDSDDESIASLTSRTPSSPDESSSLSSLSVTSISSPTDLDLYVATQNISSSSTVISVDSASNSSETIKRLRVTKINVGSKARNIQWNRTTGRRLQRIREDIDTGSSTNGVRTPEKF